MCDFMNSEKLVRQLREEIQKYISKQEEIAVIEDAISFAFEVYASKKCYNGTDFLLHVLRTAVILANLHSDYIAIVSCLVNWYITDDNENEAFSVIKDKFGSEVEEITHSLYRINQLKLKDDAESSAIYLRKILVGLSTDVRVIIVKLASRLDNLRCIYTVSSDIQKEKCKTTEKVLIPIAHRLGINYIKSELEDLCLKYTHPDEYEQISENLNASRRELDGFLDEMKSELSTLLSENGIKFRIKGRVKSIHSLYHKLSMGKRWSEIYDILALRIIVDKESECYLAIGLIHSKYRPIPRRFKDYIAQPKENMYQSLHTGVIGPNGKVFEVQIRTEEMDEIAECGVASHWSYKEHGAKAIQSLMEQKLEIFRDSIEKANDADVETEFKEMFVEQMIYVFTPNGDVIELPKGATPVDFAYRIHSHIGDTMVGAIVNDQIVPIDCELSNNDIVKINTNEASTPKKEWLKFVKTNQAKNKIKAYFSKQDKDDLTERGRELLHKEIRHRKASITETLSAANIAKMVDTLKLKDADDLFLAIGSQRYTPSYVLSFIDENRESVTDLILEKISNRSQVSKRNHKNAFSVAGCDDILVTVANCCTPVYGDDIVGFITKGNGVTVHKSDCLNIKDETARLIDVSWREGNENVYTARLLIRTNGIGNDLLDIVTISRERNVNIETVNTVEKAGGIDYELLVRVPDINLLKIFMNDLERLDFVKSVERSSK